MNRKLLIMMLLVFTLITLSFCSAHEIDNSTDVADELAICEEPALEAANDTHVIEQSENTRIDVVSKTNFDVAGDYFQVRLADSSNNPIGYTKVTFLLNNANYDSYTNPSGVASLKLRLNDGTYTVVSSYAGNNYYAPSSIATTITMSNTRVVDAGLSGSQIQSIIDSAKANNVILFKGASYSDVNLVITKSLTLLSNVGTTLKSSSSSPVISVRGDGASLTTIRGFKIAGAGDGIKVDGSDYVKIISNTISGEGNGIVALNTKYLNITKNNIVKNSKSGVSVAGSIYTYIFDNIIKNNALNGIESAKSDYFYVHGNTISNNKNGIYLAKKINGVNYGKASTNVHINKNTITKNEVDGILVQEAGDNLNMKSNTIEANKENGISLAHVGSIYIQSNVIKDNWANGIKFFDMYVRPKIQEISYNAIYNNLHMDVEAKETYFQENGVKLDVGDNWYTDYAGICPKISSNNLKFVVKQVGSNKFQATFYDSNGNIASLLPDRELTYKTADGKTVTMTIRGGTGVFTVDANDGDLVRATVDNSRRDNTFDSKTKEVQTTSGTSPTYTYPAIPNYQLYEDIGNGGGSGNGYGTGQGTGGNTNKGNGASTQESSDNTGNSTQSHRTSPANSANNPVNDVTQSYETSADTSPASASESSMGADADSGSQTQSVAKQIIIDEDEFFKVTGISFIILVMLLTIGFYYREDIREMKSKM